MNLEDIPTLLKTVAGNIEQLTVDRDSYKNELDALNVKLPCGHRKADMSDGKGGCVYCALQLEHDITKTELVTTETERGAMRGTEARLRDVLRAVSGIIGPEVTPVV